jgi:gas vesicle protein
VGIFDAIKLGIGAIAGAAVAVLFCYLVIVPSERNEAREQERAAQLQKSMDLIEKRSETNAEIRNLDDPALCVALGGLYVNNQCK